MIVYVAAPYSSPLVGVTQQRLEKTWAFTMRLISEGHTAFSPVCYFDPMATAMKLPTTADYWHQHNMQFLRISQAIFVLRLTGWDQSKGVMLETKLAKALCIPRLDFNEQFEQVDLN